MIKKEKKNIHINYVYNNNDKFSFVNSLRHSLYFHLVE